MFLLARTESRFPAAAGSACTPQRRGARGRFASSQVLPPFLHRRSSEEGCGRDPWEARWRGGSPLPAGAGQPVDQLQDGARRHGGSRFSWLLPLEGSHPRLRRTRIGAEHTADACIQMETARGHWARRSQSMVGGTLSGVRAAGQRCTATAARGSSVQGLASTTAGMLAADRGLVDELNSSTEAGQPPHAGDGGLPHGAADAIGRQQKCGSAAPGSGDGRGAGGSASGGAGDRAGRWARRGDIRQSSTPPGRPPEEGTPAAMAPVHTSCTGTGRGEESVVLEPSNIAVWRAQNDGGTGGKLTMMVIGHVAGTERQDVVTERNNAVRLQISAVFVGRAEKPGFVGARAGETCKFWSGNFAARKSWNGNCGNIGVECAPVLIHREQPAAKAVQEMNFQLAGKVQAAKQKAAAAARAGAQAEAPEALTAWQEKARQQATQDRLAAEERRKQKQKEVTEGAAAEEWLRELDSKMAKLEMENWAAPKSEAKKIRSIVQSVNPNSKFLAQPEKDRIIEGDVRMNATRVDIQEEKAQSTQLGLLRAREMVSNLAEATGGQGKHPAQLFLVISEVDPQDRLLKDEVMTFLERYFPEAPPQVTGLTVTTTGAPPATAALLPAVFEAKIDMAYGLTAELLRGMRQREVMVQGKQCTWALESSAILALDLSDSMDRKKLGAMWEMAKLMNQSIDDFNLLLTAQIRASVAEADPEKANLIVTVRVQRQRGRQEAKVRLLPEDIARVQGPDIQISLTSHGAKAEIGGLPVRLYMGGTMHDNLVEVSTRIQSSEKSSLATGRKAAQDRAEERAKAAMGWATKILADVLNIAKSARAVLAQDNARATDTQAQLRESVENLHLQVLQGPSHYDVTSNFVSGNLCKALQEMGREPDSASWERLEKLSQDMTAEVTARRGLTGPPLVVTLGPFPPAATIFYPSQTSRKSILGGRGDIRTSIEELVRQSMGVRCVVAEPVLKLNPDGQPAWDSDQGVIVVVQSLDQLKSGLPLFQEGDEGQAAGASPPWRNASRREQEVRVDKVSLVQVMIPIRDGKGKQPKSVRVRVAVQPSAEGVMVKPGVQDAISLRLLECMDKGEGIWVPLKCAGEEGLASLTPQSSGGYKAAKISALPKLPTGEFYIGNIHLWIREDQEACDEALTFLGDLWAQSVVKPMAYNSEWVIFLSTPFADEFTTGKSAQAWEDTKGFISIGESAKEVVISAAQMSLLKELEGKAAGGVWLDWALPEEDITGKVGIDPSVQALDQTGPRWIYRLPGALVKLATEAKPTLLRQAVTTLLRTKDRLSAFQGGEDLTLIMFANSVYASQLAQCEAKPGAHLPPIVISDDAVSSVGPRIAHAALRLGNTWVEVVDSVSSRAICIKHQETWSTLEEHESEDGILRLCRKDRQALELVVGEITSATVLTQSAQLRKFQPHQQGPAGLFLVGKPPSLAENLRNLSEVRAEWSDEATSRVKLPPDVYLLQEALEDELPELRYGTAAAQILGRMQDRKEVAVVKLQEGYLIIFPERMVSPFTGMTMTFQCEDQFAIPMTDLQRGIEQAASKGRTVTLQCRKAMEFAQDRSEDAARTKIADKLLEVPTVLRGMVGVQQQDKLCIAFSPDESECEGSTIDLQRTVLHPAVSDARGPKLVQTCLEALAGKVRVVPIGPKGHSLLTIPQSSTEVFVAWREEDERFRQWLPRGLDPLAELRQPQKASSENDQVMDAQDSSTAKRKKGRDAQDTSDLSATAQAGPPEEQGSERSKAQKAGPDA